MDMFMAYAQACEGDFTTNQYQLNEAARDIATAVSMCSELDLSSTYRDICNAHGVNYDGLLVEEEQYLYNQIQQYLI